MESIDKWLSGNTIKKRLNVISSCISLGDTEYAMKELKDMERFLHFLLIQYPYNHRIASIIDEDQLLEYLGKISQMKNQLLN